jgi:hypothetical protein
VLPTLSGETMTHPSHSRMIADSFAQFSSGFLAGILFA